MGQSILLVEDEPNLAFTLQLNLREEGYEVVHASDGDAAIAIFDKSPQFAAIILDIMLPGQDGFAVAAHIRARRPQVGILMLTARASDEDRLRGLRLGADDYLSKPFNLDELLARVRRMVLRADFYADTEASTPGSGKREACLSIGRFNLDPERLRLQVGDVEHDLTVLEADVLREFFANPGIVLSREHLLRHAWKVSERLETRTVDNFIVRLRKMLEEEPENPRTLVSVRGRGYVLVPEKEHDKKPGKELET